MVAAWKAIVVLVPAVLGARQPLKDVVGRNFSVPDVLGMASVEDVQNAAQLDKEVSHLRGRSSLSASAAEQDNPVKDFTDKHIAKPFMSSIHVFRMMMCWERPNLITHRDCMNYMVHHCVKGSTGKGYCTKLENMLIGNCKEGDERAVAYARKLDLECSSLDEERSHREMDELDEDEHDDDWDPNEDLAGPAPAPVPAASPGPSPGPAPLGLDKKYRPLPKQGYDEFSKGEDAMVMHENMKTLTNDWRREWPDNHETEGESVEKICQEHPEHDWCQLYLKDREKSKAFFNSFHPLGGEMHTGAEDDHIDDHIDETDKEAHDIVFDREPHHDEVFGTF